MWQELLVLVNCISSQWKREAYEMSKGYFQSSGGGRIDVFRPGNFCTYGVRIKNQKTH